MKKMIQWIAILIAVSTLFGVSALAAGNELGLAADKTELKPGDTVTVQINLTANAGMGFLALQTAYDSNVFTVVSKSAGSLLPENVEMHDAAGLAGFDLGDDLCTANVTDTGTVGTVVLQVRDGAPLGSTTLRAYAEECYTWDLQELSVSDGSLTLTVVAVDAGTESQPEAEASATPKPTAKPTEAPKETAEATEAPAEATEEPAEATEEPAPTEEPKVTEEPEITEEPAEETEAPSAVEPNSTDTTAGSSVLTVVIVVALAAAAAAVMLIRRKK